MAFANIANLGTINTATRPSTGNKIIWDGVSYYWSFYLKSTAPNTLFYSYSPNLTSWYESNITLSTNVNLTDGGEVFAQLYANGVILVTYFNYTNNKVQYAQGVIFGSQINWYPTFTQNIASTVYTSGKASYQTTLGINNTVAALVQDASGINHVYVSTNPINNFFIDSDGQWSNLQTISGANNVTQSDLVSFSTTSNKFIVVQDYNNGSVNQILWCPVDGGVHSTQILYSGANASRTNWGATQTSNNNYFVLGQSNSTAFSFYRCSAWNGDSTVFSALTAPTWPTNGLATNSGVALINDGSNVWAAVIGGDTSNTILINSYNSFFNTWGGWVPTYTTANNKAYLSSCNTLARGKAAYIWTEGTNLVTADLLSSQGLTSTASTSIIMGSVLSAATTYSKLPVSILSQAVSSGVSNVSLYSVTRGAPIASTSPISIQLQGVISGKSLSPKTAVSVFLSGVNAAPNPPRTTISGVFI